MKKNYSILDSYRECDTDGVIKPGAADEPNRSYFGMRSFCHPRESGDPEIFLSPMTFWIPAFAGMTLENYVSRVGFGTAQL